MVQGEQMATKVSNGYAGLEHEMIY